MLTAIIIDDQKEFIDMLRDQLTKLPRSVHVIDASMNAESGFLSIQKHRPDLVFLDVEMPGKNGIELANDFPLRDFEIIFTTSHDKYAAKAFKVDAVDYLIKPVDTVELSRAIERAVERRSKRNLLNPVTFLSQQKQKIAVPSLDSMVFIELDKIIFCEADNSYTTFILEGNKKIVCTKAIKDFEEQLVKYGFFRVHKSFLVNLAFVVKYIRGNGGMVVMSNNANIPVSRNAKDDLLKRLTAI
jgi:two-component system LytT family response regulator